MIATSKLISLGFLSAGIFILMQVILPIISFQVWEVGQKISSQALVSPKQDVGGKILGVSVQNKDNFPSFVSNNKRETKATYSEFKLTVPKINLSEVLVYVDSNDLTKGLAHLPATALPGEKGNVFISGHSALSRFWEADAYFAKLTDIKVGDQIEIEASGANFIYEVTNVKTISPTDLSVITPPDETGRYITLMTCVPPGLNFKRLIVLGKMR